MYCYLVFSQLFNNLCKLGAIFLSAKQKKNTLKHKIWEIQINFKKGKFVETEQAIMFIVQKYCTPFKSNEVSNIFNKTCVI